MAADTIKSVEYAINKPSLNLFLSAAASLGISTQDLLRRTDDDEAEYRAGLEWSPPQCLEETQW